MEMSRKKCLCLNTATVVGNSRRLSSQLYLLLLLIGIQPVAVAQEVKVYVSSKAGDRLSAKAPVKFGARTGEDGPTFTINDAVQYQTIDGFGASFLEAGLICINSLPLAEQESVLRALFDSERGAGFSAMKSPLAATDFMSAGPFYTYNDTPGDVEMKHFSIARDLKRNGLITFIKRARKYGNFVIQSPMDYPPDWMLIDVNKNQDVDPKYFDALALYYLRYLQEYQKNGVFIDYLSLFNEPDIYTKIPYTKIRDLLKDHVGPLLQREGVKTKIQLSEAPNREDGYRNYPIALDDPAARKYVSVLPYHGYGFKDFDKMAEIHQRYPELPLWMTEICYAYEAGTPRNMPLPRYDFEDGEFWGNQIFSDLEAHTSAWIYWNMILDQHGGPWLVSKIHEDPDPNVQHPVVIIDRDTKNVTYTGLYYYLAHFSKFVRPGSIRIQASGAVDGVRCLAFKRKDGSLVAELMNSRKADVTVSLDAGSRSVHLALPGTSITTCIWNPR